MIEIDNHKLLKDSSINKYHYWKGIYKSFILSLKYSKFHQNCIPNFAK